jgi:hypothetical protein
VRFSGIPLWGTLILATGFALSGCTGPATHSGAQPTSTPTPTSASTPNSLTLAPASTPSKVGVCSETLTFGADGDASPELCANGAVNVLAWQYFDQPGYSAILGLGANATPEQAQAALCAAPQDPLPWVLSTYELAYAYYGWTFAGMQPNEMLNDGC